MIRNQLNPRRINAVRFLKQKSCRTLVGLTRQSIALRKTSSEDGWIRGSSPRMTATESWAWRTTTSRSSAAG
jgi:hypothetical protein